MTLTFEEVTRRYGDVVAINRLSMTVGPGITALVGPNGAGKSSFMRLATGHVKPTAGRIEVFGEPVWDRPETMARIGYVPEQDALYDRLTGLQFVTDMARLSGMDKREAQARAEEELDTLGLDEARHRPIRGYSKGMRQRVKLAQALVHGPELLLLDEPMLGCDPVARRRITDRIRTMAREGKTVLVSTHILPEVAQLTKTIAVLVGGRLVARGDANTVRDALTDVPSRVRVLAGRPRTAAKALAAWQEVDAVRVLPAGVEVETPTLQSFLLRLHGRRPADWQFHGHETVDADLESLFGYLSREGA